MPAEIITAGFCPQYYSAWEVEGSKGAVYNVTLDGAERTPYCSCPAYKYSSDQNCKHIAKVWAHACLFNPQWHDAGPNDFKEHGIIITDSERTFGYGEPCPGCGVEMVAVKIAV